MNPQIIYAIVALLLLALTIFLQIKYGLLNDVSKQPKGKKPLSFARIQLAWWTFIIFSFTIAVIIASGKIPNLRDSSLVLLGLGALTFGAARVTDIADVQNANTNTNVQNQNTPLSVDQESEGWVLDILSDKNGVSIHRLQVVIFNFVFGLWFIYQSFVAVKAASTLLLQPAIDALMPMVSTNNLILLGLSAGTYAALKTTENK